MAKIGFRRLSRGVKLLTSHFYAQVDKALERFTDTGVLPENMEDGYSRFSINFSWGTIQTAIGEDGRVSAAFTLPPPQEQFDSSGVSPLGGITYTLESITASFDQRAEPKAIEADGSLNSDEVDKVAISIELWKRRMTCFGGDAGMANATQVLAVEMPNIGFIGSKSSIRTNPQVMTGFADALDPYSSYVLVVTAPFNNSAVLLDLPNLMVSLSFRSELLLADDASDTSHHNVQNMPQVPDLPTAAEYGAAYTDPVVAGTPAADATIIAEPATGDSGIQGGIELIDGSIRKGLIAGRTEMSRRFGPEGLVNQAAYDVIAVPMWGNGWYVSSGSGSNGQYLPYIGSIGVDPTCDRRLIPIKFPFVVHHVMAFYNYGDVRPTEASFTNTVGVGIGTGLRADSYAYRQVALGSWTGSAATQDVVDRFSGIGFAGVSGSGGDLINIPLVHDAAVPGIGYDSSVSPTLPAQGKPFYLGKTNSQDAVRSPAANTPGGAFVAIPSIDGREQFLEVRWSMHDTNVGINGLVAGNAVNRGGHWVYIIGKKHLC